MTGQSLAVAGKLLGHAEITSTECYAHLDGARLGAAADRVAKVVSGMLGDTPKEAQEPVSALLRSNGPTPNFGCS